MRVLVLVLAVLLWGIVASRPPVRSRGEALWRRLLRGGRRGRPFQGVDEDVQRETTVDAEQQIRRAVQLRMWEDVDRLVRDNAVLAQRSFAWANIPSVANPDATPRSLLYWTLMSAPNHPVLPSLLHRLFESSSLSMNPTAPSPCTALLDATFSLHYDTYTRAILRQCPLLALRDPRAVPFLQDAVLSPRVVQAAAAMSLEEATVKTYRFSREEEMSLLDYLIMNTEYTDAVQAILERPDPQLNGVRIKAAILSRDAVFLITALHNSACWSKELPFINKGLIRDVFLHGPSPSDTASLLYRFSTTYPTGREIPPLLLQNPHVDGEAALDRFIAKVAPIVFAKGYSAMAPFLPPSFTSVSLTDYHPTGLANVHIAVLYSHTDILHEPTATLFGTSLSILQNLKTAAGQLPQELHFMTPTEEESALSFVDRELACPVCFDHFLPYDLNFVSPCGHAIHLLEGVQALRQSCDGDMSRCSLCNAESHVLYLADVAACRVSTARFKI